MYIYTIYQAAVFLLKYTKLLYYLNIPGFYLLTQTYQASIIPDLYYTSFYY